MTKAYILLFIVLTAYFANCILETNGSPLDYDQLVDGSDELAVAKKALRLPFKWGKRKLRIPFKWGKYFFSKTFYFSINNFVTKKINNDSYI